MGEERVRSAASRTAAQRERLALLRDYSTLTRDLLIAGLILFCVVRPDILRSWLGALGVSKATLFGLELNPGNEKALASTIDTLKQQRDAAIFERNSMAKKAEEALREVERLKGADPAVTDAIASIQASTRAASAAPSPKAALNQSLLVESARRAIDGGGRWAVVYGGDTSLEAARVDMGWGQRNGLEGRTVVNRQGIFRSIVLADSPEAAEALLETARRRRPDAYVVNMQTWCPRTEQRAGFMQCL
jgi:hypothetical protein